MSDTKPPLRAYVIAFTTIYLVWGSTYLAIRVAVETMPPFAMAAVRFALAGALLFAFLRLRGVAWPAPRQWRDAAVSGFFLLLGGNGLVTWAERTVPSGVTALLIGSGPVFVVLVEWLWPGGRRPTLLTFFAMLLGFSGVAWLAAPWETATAHAIDPTGAATIVLACLSWSVGAIYGKRVRDPAPPFMAAACQMLAGGAFLALASWAHGDFAAWDNSAITPKAWLAFFYLIFAGSLAGYCAFVWLMKYTSPARAATFAYVNPVVAVFLGWFILNEPVTARTLAASAVIILSVIIVSTARAPALK